MESERKYYYKKRYNNNNSNNRRNKDETLNSNNHNFSADQKSRKGNNKFRNNNNHYYQKKVIDQSNIVVVDNRKKVEEEEETIWRVFRNHYVFLYIFKAMRGETNYWDSSISSKTMFKPRYWMINSADWMCTHRHFGLLKDKLERGEVIPFTMITPGLICSQLRDRKIFQWILSRHQDRFKYHMRLVIDACSSGNLVALQILHENKWAMTSDCMNSAIIGDHHLVLQYLLNSCGAAVDESLLVRAIDFKSKMVLPILIQKYGSKRVQSSSLLSAYEHKIMYLLPSDLWISIYGGYPIKEGRVKEYHLFLLYLMNRKNTINHSHIQLIHYIESRTRVNQPNRMVPQTTPTMCSGELYQAFIVWITDWYSSIIRNTPAMDDIMIGAISLNNFNLVQALHNKGLYKSFTDYQTHACKNPSINLDILKYLTDYRVGAKSKGDFLVAACTNKRLDLVEYILGLSKIEMKTEHLVAAVDSTAINGTVEIMELLINRWKSFKSTYYLIRTGFHPSLSSIIITATLTSGRNGNAPVFEFLLNRLKSTSSLSQTQISNIFSESLVNGYNDIIKILIKYNQNNQNNQNNESKEAKIITTKLPIISFLNLTGASVIGQIGSISLFETIISNNNCSNNNQNNDNDKVDEKEEEDANSYENQLLDNYSNLSKEIIQSASKYGQLELLQHIFTHYKTSRVIKHREQFIEAAVDGGQLAVLKFLFERSPSITHGLETSGNGTTPLFTRLLESAIQFEYLEIIKYLTETIQVQIGDLEKLYSRVSPSQYIKEILAEIHSHQYLVKHPNLISSNKN